MGQDRYLLLGRLRFLQVSLGKFWVSYPQKIWSSGQKYSSQLFIVLVLIAWSGPLYLVGKNSLELPAFAALAVSFTLAAESDAYTFRLPAFITQIATLESAILLALNMKSEKRGLGVVAALLVIELLLAAVAKFRLGLAWGDVYFFCPLAMLLLPYGIDKPFIALFVSALCAASEREICQAFISMKENIYWKCQTYGGKFKFLRPASSGNEAETIVAYGPHLLIGTLSTFAYALMPAGL